MPDDEGSDSGQQPCQTVEVQRIRGSLMPGQLIVKPRARERQVKQRRADALAQWRWHPVRCPTEMRGSGVHFELQGGHPFERTD